MFTIELVNEVGFSQIASGYKVESTNLCGLVIRNSAPLIIPDNLLAELFVPAFSDCKAYVTFLIVPPFGTFCFSMSIGTPPGDVPSPKFLNLFAYAFCEFPTFSNWLVSANMFSIFSVESSKVESLFGGDDGKLNSWTLTIKLPDTLFVVSPANPPPRLITPFTFSVTDIVGSPKNFIGCEFLASVSITIGAVNLTLYTPWNSCGTSILVGSNSPNTYKKPVPFAVSL